LPIELNCRIFDGKIPTVKKLNCRIFDGKIPGGKE